MFFGAVSVIWEKFECLATWTQFTSLTFYIYVFLNQIISVNIFNKATRSNLTLSWETQNKWMQT